jgi:hypothetical protein
VLPQKLELVLELEQLGLLHKIVGLVLQLGLDF